MEKKSIPKYLGDFEKVGKDINFESVESVHQRNKTEQLGLKKVFDVANNKNLYHKFVVSKNYYFPKVELTEKNIQLPFDFMSVVFPEEGLHVSTYKGFLLLLKEVRIISKGNYYLFEMQELKLAFNPDEEPDVLKVVKSVADKESDGTSGFSEKDIPYYLSFKLKDMELVLDSENDINYEKNMVQACLNLNFFETSHKILQIIAFLNSSNNEYKIVKRENVVKTTQGKKRKISKVIYLSKKQEQKLINNGLKAPYQKPRYSFRVRGHVRHLKSSRYITQNKEIYIKNYVKYADRELFINKEYKII